MLNKPIGINEDPIIMVKRNLQKTSGLSCGKYLNISYGRNAAGSGSTCRKLIQSTNTTDFMYFLFQLGIFKHCYVVSTTCKWKPK
uniref:Uncharacterized protein n=1 Tax=Pararge aegeria TaxID=116150 RepID=S4P4Y3_9NEOP